MNKHLNIFKGYAKKERKYQLENDLTRALAICLQEDALFFHEVLKAIIGKEKFRTLFEDFDSDIDVQIDIQKSSEDIKYFEEIFAVSLSGREMSDFWEQTRKSKAECICDMVITIGNILIVIESKRNNTDCTAQLYNQIFNILNDREKCIEDNKGIVTPFDLNWKKLMSIALKVASFEKTTSDTNRFLDDFIQLVRGHNFTWLPETPIGSLQKIDANAISRRIETALVSFCDKDGTVKKLDYRDRLGTTFAKKWAGELIFKVEQDTWDLIVAIYPGNTKGQGYSLFHNAPQFNSELNINGQPRSVEKEYHIKIAGQKYITGLWLTEDDFKKALYTRQNFRKYTGRVEKESWGVIESLLDEYINIDWRNECHWEQKIINSNRTQFNISFGYQIKVRIPFDVLSQLDVEHDDIKPLAGLIENIYKAFKDDLLIEAS